MGVSPLAMAVVHVFHLTVSCPAGYAQELPWGCNSSINYPLLYQSTVPDLWCYTSVTPAFQRLKREDPGSAWTTVSNTTNKVNLHMLLFPPMLDVRFRVEIQRRGVRIRCRRERSNEAENVKQTCDTRLGFWVLSDTGVHGGRRETWTRLVQPGGSPCISHVKGRHRIEHRIGTVKPFEWLLRYRRQVNHENNASEDLERRPAEELKRKRLEDELEEEECRPHREGSGQVSRLAFEKAASRRALGS